MKFLLATFAHLMACSRNRRQFTWSNYIFQIFHVCSRDIKMLEIVFVYPLVCEMSCIRARKWANVNQDIFRVPQNNHHTHAWKTHCLTSWASSHLIFTINMTSWLPVLWESPCWREELGDRQVIGFARTQNSDRAFLEELKQNIHKTVI